LRKSRQRESKRKLCERVSERDSIEREEKIQRVRESTESERN
jgi:hypothetical protein